MSQDSNKIDASPTKEFFISILTRDISLLDAVKDLVDNCVDGARRLRPDGNFRGLWVEVEFNPGSFVIVDNCGGISVETARNYAFRFGRPAGAPRQEGSIGQFGVGMKRALFKIGAAFEIQSVATESRFKLAVDVDDWKRLKDGEGKDVWEFEFTEAQEGQTHAIEECGTTLQVTKVHPPIGVEFSSDTFKARLIAGLQEAHARSMDNGLQITVNETPLHYRMATLLASEALIPIRIAQVFPADPTSGIDAPVRMELFAGVADSDLSDAGWYIVCNGRQIVKADKTALTGWDTAIGETKTPRAHAQFARFRGYVLFESSSAGALPWNTSKSGVDVESRIYQWALSQMVPALRQVIDFLNALDAEMDTESTYLRSLVQRARAVRLSEVKDHQTFSFPSERPRDDVAKTVRVQFDRGVEDVEFAKSFFKATSARKAGEAAFDYFMSREGET